jgi:hypothetical protein
MEQDTQRRRTVVASGELHWDIDDAPSSPPQIKHHARNISLVFSDTGPLSEIDENEIEEDDDEAHDDNEYADDAHTQGELLDADELEEKDREDVAADWAAEADDDDDDDDDAWASAREAATSPVWAGSAPVIWDTADDDTDDTAIAAVDLAWHHQECLQ